MTAPDFEALPPALPDAPPGTPPVEHLDRKARWLLVAVFLLVAAAVAYVLYARGVFERTQTVVLVAENSEGAVVGMDLTFSGFPIGRVARIELAKDGNANIVVEVPRKDAHWLRESSVFTMESGVVGATRLRAYSGILTDPPLPDGAVRKVLAGDAAAEIPRLMAAVRDLIANLTTMTGTGSPLNASLRSVQATAEKLNGPRGALGVLLGNEQEAARLMLTLDRTNALLLKLDGLAGQAGGLAKRVDGIAARVDAQVLGDATGQGGVVAESRATIVQLNGLLADARSSLKRVDAVLEQAQGIAANTREASADLGTLRAEVEASLRKVEQLVNEVNRKWPFKRDAEIKLP